MLSVVCQDDSVSCFEYEDDYEEGYPKICRHCLVENGKGKCELAIRELPEGEEK